MPFPDRLKGPYGLVLVVIKHQGCLGILPGSTPDHLLPSYGKGKSYRFSEFQFLHLYRADNNRTYLKEQLKAKVGELWLGRTNPVHCIFL